jgi:hypothetical protein
MKTVLIGLFTSSIVTMLLLFAAAEQLWEISVWTF